MPASARMAPTDRSMPAVSTTHVMPMARMPLMEVWRRMSAQLPQVMKWGLASASAAHSAISAMTTP